MQIEKSLKNTSGQIMVITLLVLTVITVIVVSVILIASKDVEQQTNTKEYERYLDKAEEAIINTISSFDEPDYSLQSLVDDPTLAGDNADCSLFDQKVTCNLTDSDGLSKVILEIEDTKNVEEYTIAKDDTFTMDLGNYQGLLKISWTGETAMSFTLGFRRSGQYMSLSDVFDTKGILTDAGNDPLNDTPPFTHALAFRPYQQSLSTSTEIVLSETDGLLAGDELINLTFKPIMDNADGYTDLTVLASGVLKEQVRVYRATAHAVDIDEFGSSPAPTVISKVPLYPQVPAITDYVLLTGEDVNKTENASAGLFPIPPNCGNRKVTSDEECDDGNNNNTDNCSVCCLSNTITQYIISAKSSVCSAGGTTSSTSPSCGSLQSYGYDDPPSAISIPAGTDYFIITGTAGSITYAPLCGSPASHAEGNKNSITGLISCSGRPISGFQGYRMALSGVILKSNNIPDDPVPERFTYAGNNHNTVSEMRPQIQQSFILGDGVGNTGTQKFYVPDGGRYLYLGFFESENFANGDAKCYGDNCNSLRVTIRFIRTKCG